MIGRSRTTTACSGMIKEMSAPVAMIPSTGEITLLQMDGHASAADLKKALEQAKPAFQHIAEAQRAAIKARYAEAAKKVKE